MQHIKHTKQTPMSHESRIAIKAAAIITAIIILTLFGCTTSKTVTETLVTHDTLTVHHTDTLHITHKVATHDTLRLQEFHTYTLNNVGDTIKEVHNHYEMTKVIIVDSTHRYQAKVDSLTKALNKEREKNKVKKKRYVFSWIDYGVIALMLIGAAVFWLYPRIRKKSS